METNQEYTVKREANVAKIEAQLNAWSTQFDGLVKGYLVAGAQSHGACHIRVDGWVGAGDAQRVQQTLGQRRARGDLPGGDADDWTALEARFNDLTR